MKTITRIALLATAFVVLFSAIGFAQEINLDKMKKAGDLTCYPSLKDPNVWYYLPDQPRLAMKRGKPQFSFMKYSRTAKQGKAGINQAEGGGILHFLVTYGATKDRVQNAERRLQEVYPEAHIEGPIVYRKGSFALITSFTKDNQDFVRTVAVGKAPLMEGQKAAVSMALSRSGAELLWESFKSDTPDISLVFDMEFAGIREPYEATIEADWSRVSKHKRFKAGFKYSWFGADVDMLFQELRQNGAIKITTKGENANMDKIIQSANAKLLQVMFDPAPVDELSKMAAEKDSYSSLNQAMKMIKADQGSKKSSALPMNNKMDLNTPGFYQLIAAVLDILVSDAYAADDSADISEIQALPPNPEDKDDGTPKLTPAQKTELQAYFVQAQKYYLAKEYHEAAGMFGKVNEGFISYIGQPSGEALFNMGVCYMKLTLYELAAQHFWEAGQVFGDNTKDGKDALKKGKEAEEKARLARQGGGVPGKDPNTSVQKSRDPKPQVAATSASEAYNHARRLDAKAKKEGYPKNATQDAIDAYQAYVGAYSPTGARKKEIDGRLRSLNRRLEQAQMDDAMNAAIGGSSKTKKQGGKTPGTVSKPSKKQSANLAKSTAAKPATASKKATAATSKKVSEPSKQKADKPSAAKKPSKAVKRAASKKPGFSLVASYRMKNIKRSGKLVYHMNHFRSEMQGFPMMENIGSLYRRYGSDHRVFRAVTIDDPVFKQREIIVTLDGQDAATFTKYLNFVTVKMKKRHQSGEYTTDEVVITPELFNTSGNSFSFNYGYKGDTDRNRWLEYQYQVIWSFHGGVEVRSSWKKQDSPMLSLMPPHRYRSLSIEGDGEELKNAKVRHAVVTIKTMLNGKPIITQATIRNQGPAPVMLLDVPEEVDGEKSRVSIKWFLKGGKKLESAAQPIQGDIIYWDELPN